MTIDNFQQQLEQIQSKRGYLLPHHGLMALTSPDLLQDYDRLYQRITLTQGFLSRHQHESVWIAILSVLDERFGTHHVHKFQQAGGTTAQMNSILTLAAMARGHGAFAFARDHWQTQAPDLDATAAYLQAFDDIGSDLDPALPHLIGIAAQTCLRKSDALSSHIQAAYEREVDERAIAEAMLMTMLPGSVPNLVAAAGVWRGLVVDGQVNSSADIRSWANMSGQDGWSGAAKN